MANETIADIITEIRREMPVYASGILCSNMTEVAVHEFADRIEAAHKAESVEVVRLKAALEKIAGATAVTNLCIIYECPYVGDDSVMCSGCEYCSRNIARAAIAAEGGAK